MKRLLLILAGLSLMATAAYGAEYDIDANNFYTKDQNTGKIIPDELGFQAIMRELAFVTTNKFLGPGKTLGILGFEISSTLAITDISEANDYWAEKSGIISPPNFIPSMQLTFSKGLFMSLELNGYLTHIFKTSIWGIGFDLKASLIEGYRYAPELTVYGGVDTLMGTKGYTLLTIPAGVMVSKAFGLAGMIRVVPFAGYRVHIFRGASEVLYAFEGDKMKEFVIAPFWEVAHGVVLGLTVKGGVVLVGFETVMGSELKSFAFKLGVNF